MPTASPLRRSHPGLLGDFDSGTIGRANLDGTGVYQSLITGSGAPYISGVAVDAAHIYWVNSNTNTIGRANLDGTEVDQNFIGAVGPRGIAVDAEHVYWASYGGPDTIGRANLDGSGAHQGFITNASRPRAVAVDGDYVYWTNRTLSGKKTIGRANLDAAVLSCAARGFRRGRPRSPM